MVNFFQISFGGSWMRTNLSKPFIWMALFVLVVSLACNLGRSAEPTAVPSPTDAPQETLSTKPPEPTQPPAPTATDTPLPEPTEPPTPTEAPTDLPEPTEEEASDEPPAYYIEEFDGDISNYSYFLQSGTDRGDEMIYTDNGNLTFDLTTPDTWVYVTYDPWIYQDVRIGMSAVNRGNNSQNISLICRYSDSGWFEFNIGGDGLYDILVFNGFENQYELIFNGGSTLINLGKDTNEYIGECIGNSLSLYINGELAREVTIPSDYSFMDEGQVGFSVSSFDSLPILVLVEWFGIEAP
jgi:hypothetical protein